MWCSSARWATHCRRRIRPTAGGSRPRPARSAGRTPFPHDPYDRLRQWPADGREWQITRSPRWLARSRPFDPPPHRRHPRRPARSARPCRPRRKPLSLRSSSGLPGRPGFLRHRPARHPRPHRPPYPRGGRHPCRPPRQPGRRAGRRSAYNGSPPRPRPVRRRRPPLPRRARKPAPLRPTRPTSTSWRDGSTRSSELGCAATCCSIASDQAASSMGPGGDVMTTTTTNADEGGCDV